MLEIFWVLLTNNIDRNILTLFYLRYFYKLVVIHIPIDIDNPNLCALKDTYRNNNTEMFAEVNGCGMGPLLVLVSPCFMENVVVTCRIESFLCSLDNLLQENVIVFFFGNQISKWRSFGKGHIFDLLFTFNSYQGKVTKIPSAHISLTYIHVFCSPFWPFLPYQFWKKIRIYQVWFLFSMSPSVDSHSRHFGTINK